MNHPLEIIDPSRPSENFAGLCALGVMTKAPEAGKVKTRLTPPLTPEEAAALNTCFLRDLSLSIDRASDSAPARGVAVYTPVGKESAYNDILSPRFLMIPQRGDQFGERLELAVTDVIVAGFSSVCLINSDSPTVPAECFAEAATVLANAEDRIVIGPSDDGGYYLIGMQKLHRALFEEIEWSTERVFDQTMARARELGIEVHQLANGYDVDDRATLQRLCEQLLSGGTANDVAPNTQTFLRDIVDREGRDRIWPSKL